MYIGAIYPYTPYMGYMGVWVVLPLGTPPRGVGVGVPPTHPSGVRVYITRGSAEVLK